MIIKNKNSFLIILLYLYILIISFSSIKSQKIEKSEAQNEFKKILENFDKTNPLYQKLNDKMKNIRFNFILKIKYNNLKTKQEKIVNKINSIKENFQKDKIDNNNSLKEIHNLNILIESYINNCYNIINLYDSFTNLNDLVVNIIKIFVIIIIIGIIFAMIYSGIRYIYMYRTRKNYEILRQEINHSSFRNINDSDFEKTKLNGKNKNKKKNGKN